MMKMSTEVNELFKAFSAFQGQVENATKNAMNPGVKNKYADLAECINTAKPMLAANGLGVTQMIGSADDGKQTLTTMMTHSSGQWMSDTFVMVEAVLMGGAGKNPVQALGSAITYQRRYSFAAMIGIAQEDDDGNSNTKARQPAQPVKQVDPAINEAINTNNASWVKAQYNPGVIKDNWASLTPVQIDQIHILLNQQ